MEYSQFNLRLSRATAEALQRLADATQRSRSGVVRWLIQREAEKLGPPVAIPPANKDDAKSD